MRNSMELPYWGFPGDLVAKNLPANAGAAGNAGSIPGLGRSPGGGNGNPLLYSNLENLERVAWWSIVHGFTRVRHDFVIKQQQQYFVVCIYITY